ncbi:DUF1800 domain-containing protein [Trinickia mobilis]|uniref:DUF1800 domain-containing protein n=1 Tax=Trinickia mobilis TaxID=2816356 RepID=UPI001F5D81CD|nr:DUF1800 domain-containing protein [Trinickia mobilis]
MKIQSALKIRLSMATCVLALAAAVSALTMPDAQAQAASAVHSLKAKHHKAHVAVPDGPDQPLLDANDARFFLTRVGFAPDSNEVAPYVGLSREQAVDKVLGAARTQAVTPLPVWASEPIPTRAEQRERMPDERRAEQQTRGQRYEALRAWWVREMVVTPSPLTERMTLFWHNHFTSGQDKVGYPQVMLAQDVLLRREALGNFGVMLHDVAKDPAMLLYLDGASNRKGRPNENFAREAMELFTLGEGHYSQHDVSEAARAYTGWAVDPDTQAFVFRPQLHDDGLKTVLGRTGPFDGDQVLDILLAQPETATLVTTELWREFVSEAPDAVQIAPIADRFRASRYDIKVALRGLFLSDAFWNEDNRGVLVKSPVEFVVGTLREFDVAYDGTEPFAGAIRNLGENLFYPPNVKGWPGGQAWINSSTLLARKQFVEQLFRATEPGKLHPMKLGAAGAGSPGISMAGGGMAAASPTVAANTRAQKAMAKAGPGSMRFDLDGWLAQFGAAPSGKPGLSAELQLQHAVLPIAPVDAIDTDSTGSAYLEALLMDPAYQLK